MVVTVLSIHMLLFYFKTTYSFIDVLRRDFKYIIEIEIVISIHNDCCALHGGQEIPFLLSLMSVSLVSQFSGVVEGPSLVIIFLLPTKTALIK